MEVFQSKEKIKNKIADLKAKEVTIGFVATMGALHLGHLSLVKKALAKNQIVVVSIFVNPTQFDNQTDLDNYPRTLDHDIQLLKTVSKERILVFAPAVGDIYTDGVKSNPFSFDGLEFEMEGKFRAGHFNGVGTIVKALLEIVQPDNAYFGEKDFQQFLIIKKLVEKYNLPVNIIGCKISRETNGLAMSSRNERLNASYKKAAPFIYKTLLSARKKFGTESAFKVKEWVIEQFKNNELLELEYFLIADDQNLKPIQRKSKKKKYRAFIAVYADDVRLIDNIALN